MASQSQTKVWAYEDLFDLPEGRRYEIIEGKLYEMPAPNLEHAWLIANLIQLVLGPVVWAQAGKVLTAPADVFLPGANPVQPDLFVLLPEQFAYRVRRGVEGPPALIVEVLSPGNPRHDLVLKRWLYERAGVREYWIVSPEAMSVEILALDGGRYRTHARVAGDEPLSSVVLPGIASPASVIFEQ